LLFKIGFLDFVVDGKIVILLLGLGQNACAIVSLYQENIAYSLRGQKNEIN